MRKALVYITLALFVGLALSCKKDDSTTETPSLQGLYFTEDPLPFVAPGTPVSLHAEVDGIYASDGSTLEEPLGIYWMVSSERDTTTRNVKVSNPDYVYTTSELGKVTIYCYVYSTGGGYTNASASVTYSVIDPETSLSGLEGNTTRIGQNKFYLADIDGTTWMANNLYGTQSGVSFYLSDVTDSFMGKFYSWEEARTACPQGWKLPSAQEWDALGTDACALMANAVLLEEQMWTYWPGMNITNSKGFNAIPAGYVDLTGGQANVQGFMDYAIFWTSSEAEEPGMAQYRYIYSDQPEVQQGVGSQKSLALSVRCIKE